jgi:hypothetical protein
LHMWEGGTSILRSLTRSTFSTGSAPTLALRFAYTHRGPTPTHVEDIELDHPTWNTRAVRITLHTTTTPTLSQSNTLLHHHGQGAAARLAADGSEVLTVCGHRTCTSQYIHIHKETHTRTHFMSNTSVAGLTLGERQELAAASAGRHEGVLVRVLRDGRQHHHALLLRRALPRIHSTKDCQPRVSMHRSKLLPSPAPSRHWGSRGAPRGSLRRSWVAGGRWLRCTRAADRRPTDADPEAPSLARSPKARTRGEEGAPEGRRQRGQSSSFATPCPLKVSTYCLRHRLLIRQQHTHTSNARAHTHLLLRRLRGQVARWLGPDRRPGRPAPGRAPAVRELARHGHIGITTPTPPAGNGLRLLGPPPRQAPAQSGREALTAALPPLCHRGVGLGLGCGCGPALGCPGRERGW